MNTMEYAIKNIISANELKKIRKKLKLSQAEFAKLANVNKRTVENWEMKNEPIKGVIVSFVRLLEMYPEVVDKLQIPKQDTPLRLYYMFGNDICSVIDVDEIHRKVKVYNYTDNLIFRAFGVKLEPSFEDYEDFLKSRCFPEERDKMKLMLKEYNIPFYDPLLIIEKTEGRMEEDDFWIKIRRKR